MEQANAKPNPERSEAVTRSVREVLRALPSVERALGESALGEAIESAGRPITVQVQPEDTLQDALSAMLTTSSGMAVVVDARGRYLGGCTIEGLASLLLHTGNGNGSA
mgnify:CR=1 FL=1